MKTDVVFVPELNILLLKGFQALQVHKYFIVHFNKAELREQQIVLNLALEKSSLNKTFPNQAYVLHPFESTQKRFSFSEGRRSEIFPLSRFQCIFFLAPFVH